MAFILIYVTHKNEQEAKKIVTHLLKKKLIACANTFPITSSYWWKGTIENGDELVTLLKTRKDLWNTVRKEIEQLHPYETPCIMKISVEANAAYESWIQKETGNATTDSSSKRR